MLHISEGLLMVIQSDSYSKNFKEFFIQHVRCYNPEQLHYFSTCLQKKGKPKNKIMRSVKGTGCLWKIWASEKSSKVEEYERVSLYKNASRKNAR